MSYAQWKSATIYNWKKKKYDFWWCHRSQKFELTTVKATGHKNFELNVDNATGPKNSELSDVDATTYKNFELTDVDTTGYKNFRLNIDTGSKNLP